MRSRFGSRLPRLLLLAAVLATLALSSDERAQAAVATDALAIGADISATCTMNVSVALDFGTFDLLSVVPQNGFGVISVSCTTGSPIYITLGQGLYPAPGSTDTAPLRQMSAGGTARLAYNLYRDAAYTIPWGNTPTTGAVLTGSGTVASATLYAQLPPGQQVLSGTYQDSVLATVTY